MSDNTKAMYKLSIFWSTISIQCKLRMTTLDHRTRIYFFFFSLFWWVINWLCRCFVSNIFTQINMHLNVTVFTCSWSIDRWFIWITHDSEGSIWDVITFRWYEYALMRWHLSYNVLCHLIICRQSHGNIHTFIYSTFGILTIFIISS